MNSTDPWNTILTDEYGDVVYPRPYYGHPFYREVPSWIHYGDGNGTRRLLFDGAFVGADPVVAGFFDSVKHAVLKYTGTTATNQFIKDHGLEPYVKKAATAVATVYGGPAAGAAAGALSGPVMSLGVKDKKKEAAAKKQVQQLSTAMQQQSPELSPAVDIAHDVINKTATTYHVAKITNDAKAGSPDAQRALDNLKQAADRGDVQAQQALQLVAVIDREQRKAESGGAVSGWVDIIGASMPSIVGAQLTALSAPGAWYPYGSFVGAETPPTGRTGLTAAVAPILAPATGGISVKKELDDKQVLHVEICVDGKCHKTSMDLGPAIAMLMQKLASWHTGQHTPSTVVSTVGAAVIAAEDALVGSLIDRHVDTVCGSFLGDIGHAVKHAAGGLAGGVASTLSKFKGPISSAAGYAAGAVATAYGGPAAGLVAKKLANDLVNSASGDDKAKKAVAQATQQAKTDPTVALALDQAQKAVANATVAHHVQETAKKAAQGHSDSQKQIAQVADDAQKGDPAAKAVADLVTNAMHSEWGSKLWEGVTGRGPATVSGNDVSGLRSYEDRAKRRVLATARSTPAASFYMWILDADGRERVQPFASADEMYATRKRKNHNYYYAMFFEKADPSWPNPVTTSYGCHAPEWSTGPGEPQVACPATVNGWYDIVGRGFGGSGAGGGPRAPLQATNLNTAALNQVAAGRGSLHGYVAGWYDIVGAVPGTTLGASLDDLRAKAVVLANAKAGGAIGVIHSKKDNAWYIHAFGSLDDAIDWLQRSSADRASFTYAAVYEKGSDGLAYLQGEEVGGSRRPAAPSGEQIRRGVASTSG